MQSYVWELREKVWRPLSLRHFPFSPMRFDPSYALLRFGNERLGISEILHFRETQLPPREIHSQALRIQPHIHSQLLRIQSIKYIETLEESKLTKEVEGTLNQNPNLKLAWLVRRLWAGVPMKQGSFVGWRFSQTSIRCLLPNWICNFSKDFIYYPVSNRFRLESF